MTINQSKMNGLLIKKRKQRKKSNKGNFLLGLVGLVGVGFYNILSIHWMKKQSYEYHLPNRIRSRSSIINEEIPMERSGGISIAQESVVKDFTSSILHSSNSASSLPSSSNRPLLTAFFEPIYLSDWDQKPLPPRNTTAQVLTQVTYPQLNSCSRLPALFPVDEAEAPTNRDPFLPWIHDVFPTADGQFIQFVAQNKRRCQTGKNFAKEKEWFQPNAALFQHVPVKRVTIQGEQRYQLTDHKTADPDGIETRFICRFKTDSTFNSSEYVTYETLSVHNVNYDYHTLRKGYKSTFTKEGFDNHMIWTSQLLFKCPVPAHMVEDIRLGRSVVNDYAKYFVDLIPIRTPVRYGSPWIFLPDRLFSEKNSFDVQLEYGESHILPKIQDSGRLENIPICKPSLMTYPDPGALLNMNDAKAVAEYERQVAQDYKEGKKKKLISCAWTSAVFQTRGGRTTVSDGNDRLLQWLEFERLVGSDHVYIFDNSGAFSNETSLQPITDLFPGFVTRIDWPAKVCNNNKGNVDNKGERSSQYAAESSCRLRFGEHSEWLAAHDTDEYLIPQGKHQNLKDLLAAAEKEDLAVINFPSKRSKPRLRFFDVDHPPEYCNDCLDTTLPENKTFLGVYNCNYEKPPRKNLMPAEKAIYRPDFVRLFFVHYATMTVYSQTGMMEAKAKGESWTQRARMNKRSRFVDEATEGTMLHTKAVVPIETRKFNQSLFQNPEKAGIGVEWPPGMDLYSNATDEKYLKTIVVNGVSHEAIMVDINGKSYFPNCFTVPNVDEHWVPLLENAIQRRISKIE